MKNIIFCLLANVIFLFSINIAFSQQNHNMNPDNKNNKDSNPAVLIPGLGNYHHKVTTNSKQAQKFFDQGLILIYAFNHNEAIRSFRKAAELDPMMAMAYWGIAFALGPNYNLPADNEQRKLAYKSMKKALKHSYHVSQSEKDYIKALSKRYTSNVDKIDQQTLDIKFKNAMNELYKKYPDDPDAATLYAESLMNLKPWQLWNKDGTPAEGTEEIVSVLEFVLKKNPNHPGANHYYIHAVEASNDPGKALASANVLKTLIPAAGHLVHMPAHTLFRIGDYEGASIANIEAIKSDQSYISTYKPEGIYPAMYYNHNINFLTVSEMMEGKYSESIKNANLIAENVKPLLNEMQMLEGFYANPLFIDLSFGKWKELLSYPEPDTAFKLYSALLYFCKSIAYAYSEDIPKSETEYNKFISFKSKVPANAILGLNSASLILNIAQNLIESKLALAGGDTAAAITLLKSAIEKEDLVNYNEPPDWYPSVRLTLGAVYYLNKNYADAEKIFRNELLKYPHNGRGLYGLMESLKAQNKNEESESVSKDYAIAWKNADVNLNLKNY